MENTIVLAMRKLTRQWKPIQNVKKRAKIGPELFKCEGCGQIVYSGDRGIAVIQVDVPEAIADKIEVDHIDPVIPVDTDPAVEKDLNVLAKRIFCGEDNLQALCKSGCHALKTLSENEERKKWKAHWKKLRSGKK
jgi:hypothetical protein